MSSYPNQSWMSKCQGRTKLTPHQFVFPGTHDTGAYQRPDFNLIADSEKIATSPERFAPGFQDIATRWTLSQPGQTIYDQLMNGVRYLDFRCSYAKNGSGQMEYFLIHTFVVSEMDTVFNDIVRFLAAHPTELILMEFVPYYQIDPRNFEQYIYSKVGKYLYPDKSGVGVIGETVDAITKQGKQIIAMLHQSRISPAFFMWSDLIYNYPFLSVDNVPAKQAYLTKGLNMFLASKSKTKFQLTYTLTEVAIDVAASIFAGGSLKKFADTLNPTQMGYVKSLTRAQRDAIGVISNDDQVNCQNVAVALLLIAERAAALEPVARPLKAHESQSSKVPLSSGPAMYGESAWSVAKPHKVHQQQSRPIRRKKVSCLRYVCSCLCCCGSTGSQSNDEDERPLVR